MYSTGLRTVRAASTAGAVGPEDPYGFNPSQWSSIKELKEVLQDEWSKITIQEVRARISDMPRRCKILVESSGGPIKTAQW